MKKIIALAVLGSIASVNSFAGVSSEVLKQIARGEEVSFLQIMANSMSKKGLESSLAMEAAFKNAPKNLASKEAGYMSIAELANNGKSGQLISHTISEGGAVRQSVVKMSESSIEPSDTAIYRIFENLYVRREFQTEAGRLNIIQAYSTAAKKTGYVSQNSYVIGTTTMGAELKPVALRFDGEVVHEVSVRIATHKNSFECALRMPNGFYPNAFKINSAGTEATVYASNGKTMNEYVYSISASDNKRTIYAAGAAVRTLSAAEAKQFLIQVENIAGRKSTSAPVRGMQIETSANVAK